MLDPSWLDPKKYIYILNIYIYIEYIPTWKVRWGCGCWADVPYGSCAHRVRTQKCRGICTCSLVNVQIPTCVHLYTDQFLVNLIFAWGAARRSHTSYVIRAYTTPAVPTHRLLWDTNLSHNVLLWPSGAFNRIQYILDYYLNQLTIIDVCLFYNEQSIEI